jgi:hypothetical protein
MVDRPGQQAFPDCCTRELVGWSLELRCRDDEAIACVEAAVMDRGVRPGQLTLGTDNGSQFTSRDSAATCRPAGSPTAGAATAIQSRKHSSSPGSDSSRNAWRGGLSGSRWTRRERRSPHTSPRTSIGPTPGWPTARPSRSPRPGGPTPTCYKPPRPDPSTPTGSTSRRRSRW